MNDLINNWSVQVVAMLVMTSPVGATSGAKCGQITARRIGEIFSRGGGTGEPGGQEAAATAR